MKYWLQNYKKIEHVPESLGGKGGGGGGGGGNINGWGIALDTLRIIQLKHWTISTNYKFSYDKPC